MRVGKYRGMGSIGVIGGLLWLSVIVAGVFGWVMNIIKLFGMINDPVTGMMIFRGVGILVAPLGAVLGYL